MSQLDSKRWRRLQEQFNELVDCAPSERAQRLQMIHAAEPALAEELRALLEADANADDSDTISVNVDGAVQKLASDVEAGGPVPTWIGDYRITGILGSGGMGVVYLAEQESPRRTVALKVIRSYGGGTAVRRFQREAQLHGRLQHPGIALVYEAGMATERDERGVDMGPPRPFFAMERVQGQSVAAYVQFHKLDTAQRVEIMAKICDAVEHAHTRNVIHRDLKSANVLVDDDGNPKVLDFGIARSAQQESLVTTYTGVGEVIGTLPYMSPEQVSGTAPTATPQTDIYALGVVFFEMLAGRRPLDLTGRSLPEAVRIVTHDEPTRLGTVDRALRGDIETIVARCLEKDPARRYATAGALGADLRRYLEHRPIEARPPSALYQIAKFTRRHRPLVAGTATAFAALLAATVVSLVMAVKAERARADVVEQLNRANTENTRSNYTYRFMEEMITSADPTVFGPNDMTLREYVRKSAAKLNDPSLGEDQIAGVLARFIGVTLYRLGDVDAAERAMRRSMEMLSKSDEHTWQPQERMIELQLSLTELLNARGKSAEALPLMKDAVATRRRYMESVAREKRPRPESEPVPDRELADPFLAVSVRTLGLTQHAFGQYADAEQTLQRACALEQALQETGWIRPGSVASTMMALAKTQMARGKHEPALKLMREAVAMQEDALGADAFGTQTARNNLGAALTDVGLAKEAIPLLKGVVDHQRAHLPAQHFEIALAELNLARALGHDGQSSEGLTVAQPAAERIFAVFGKDSQMGWRAQMIVAPLLAATGDNAGALQAAAECRDSVARMMGGTHPLCVEAAALCDKVNQRGAAHAAE